jgi:sulfoxide reductase heme-binding subunit YedZ
MIKRLGAKRWKKLHELIYFAAIAGVVHYWMLVKADTRRPKAYAAALAVLLGFRVVWYVRGQWQAKKRTEDLGLRTEM